MRRALWAFVLVLPGTLSAQEACRPDEVVILDGGSGAAQARFSVEIADDAPERARGLMHRESLAQSHGMLFVYEAPQQVAFWMENTLIPLDMIFTDRTGRVTRVHDSAVPLDRTPIPGGDEVLAVLEINGGLAAALGIGPGDMLRHPVFGAEAAAPCAGE
ncbi:hypothetical protein SAMN05443573_101551 [Celeribacter indicus]|uniref:DUF192 domain-containing protein n=2 Tax=Celeribacter indicus TaxID=1208324 RepID=A0A0B5DXJ1_9RHOB|nr:hypothetical protein P73_2989 [Celeribacter indicus]SDW14747.1 hypothetical protein SAMN05443573_101551 [Celeribacter indicus]